MNRPLFSRLFTPGVVCFFFIWILFLLLFRERGFFDPGSLWHIRVGEIILTKGFPWTDPFTYTFADHSWIPQQWGAEVLMYASYRVGGFDTMLLAFVTGIAALFTWAFIRLVRSGMHPMLAGIVMLGFFSAGAFHYYIRAHMFTILLLAWTMVCIIDYERGRVGISRLAWLIPLYVIWTNLHGGVLGGMVTLGLAVAGWIAVWGRRSLRRGTVPSESAPNDDASVWIPTPVRNRRTAILLILILVACGLTLFVNPFGLELLRTWQKLVGSPVLRNWITEHHALNFNRSSDIVVFAVGVVYIVLLLGIVPWRWRVSWVLPLAWYVFTFDSIRQGPLFAITGVFAVADFWPHTVWYRLLKKYGDTLVMESVEEGTQRIDGYGFLVPAAFVVLALGLQVGRVEVPIVGSNWARLDPDMTPVDLNDVMIPYAQSVPEGTHIFNDANMGGYLIFYTPRLKIFMDDRCELFGDAWIQNYAESIYMEPSKLGPIFEGWHEQYGFDRAIVVVPPKDGKGDQPKLDAYLASVPNLWREVARRKRAAVYERMK